MINITRTDAATTEQVITNRRALLHAILPELTTTGVVTVRNEGSAVMVGQVANVAATAGAAGTLDDDQYFVTVVAVDRNGDTGTAGTEDSDTTAAGAGLGSVSVAWDATTNASSYRVYVGQATGDYLGYFNATASPFVVTSILQAAFEAGGAWTSPSAGAPTATTGDTNLQVRSAIGLTQAGKQVGGAQLSNGITVLQSVSTDRCAIVWEPLG